MAIVDSFKELITKAFDDERIHAFFFCEVTHIFFQIILKILKDEYKFSIGMHDLPKSHNIDVREFFEDGDFSDGSGRNALLLTF